MKITKLQLEDFTPLNFTVVGLISDFVDYKLAYFFNQEVENFFFNRIQNLDVWVNKKEFSYITYEFYDYELDASIFLIKNKPEVTLNNETSNNKENFKSLFSHSPLLVPELKKYNYILKINKLFKLEVILDFLKYFNKIQFHSNIQTMNQKTIRNLIF